MKDFNLHEAKMGAEVCTREGGYAKITTFDNGSITCPITAIYDLYGYENKTVFRKNGRFRSDGKKSRCDLMLK